MKEVVREYYNNGNLKFELPYNEDGNLHGAECKWLENGNLDYKQGNFNGKFHGVGIYYGRKTNKIYYDIHGKPATEEEWREYELMTQLAGIED